MQRLFAFLYQNRVLGFFLFLEFVCVWMLVSYNHYYNAHFFNSSNALAGSIQLVTQNTTDYIRLKVINQKLLEENLRLRQELANINIVPREFFDDKKYYDLIGAKVINNNFRRSENFMTLDKGEHESIFPGMGVISSQGAVGVIKSTSGNFSTVTSLLHQNLMISCQLKKTKTLCTAQWDAQSSLQTELRFVPRHIPLNVGDTVVTSGFNSIFPPDILIGLVESVDFSDESPFYNAHIRLAVDFSSIDYVYVIHGLLKTEKDSLEAL